ncbi:hypothetical protein DM2_972 [Halorubrum sp. DM2]|nr:hypothetical protein DM2_972 [Halorubrum sp. DM2]
MALSTGKRGLKSAEGEGGRRSLRASPRSGGLTCRDAERTV